MLEPANSNLQDASAAEMSVSFKHLWFPSASLMAHTAKLRSVETKLGSFADHPEQEIRHTTILVAFK
jgi:hypothetical protein